MSEFQLGSIFQPRNLLKAFAAGASSTAAREIAESDRQAARQQAEDERRRSDRQREEEEDARDRRDAQTAALLKGLPNVPPEDQEKLIQQIVALNQDDNPEIVRALITSARGQGEDQGDPFTLSPGQIRFDASGQQIATGGEKVETPSATQQDRARFVELSRNPERSESEQIELDALSRTFGSGGETKATAEQVDRQRFLDLFALEARTPRERREFDILSRKFAPKNKPTPSTVAGALLEKMASGEVLNEAESKALDRARPTDLLQMLLGGQLAGSGLGGAGGAQFSPDQQAAIEDARKALAGEMFEPGTNNRLPPTDPTAVKQWLLQTHGLTEQQLQASGLF